MILKGFEAAYPSRTSYNNMAMPDDLPEPRSSGAALELILPLGLSHPSIPELLALKPLARPSALTHSTLTKFCNRLNAAVLGRDGESSAKVACGLARRVILDDEEGWVLSEYGKGWVNACLTDLAVSHSLVLRGSTNQSRSMTDKSSPNLRVYLSLVWAF